MNIFLKKLNVFNIVKIIHFLLLFASVSILIFLLVKDIKQINLKENVGIVDLVLSEKINDVQSYMKQNSSIYIFKTNYVYQKEKYIYYIENIFKINNQWNMTKILSFQNNVINLNKTLTNFYFDLQLLSYLNIFYYFDFHLQKIIVLDID